MTDKELDRLAKQLENQEPIEVSRGDLIWLVKIAQNRPVYKGLTPGTGLFTEL